MPTVTTALQPFVLSGEWLTKPAPNGTVRRSASASEPGRGRTLELGLQESWRSCSGWWEKSLLVRGFLEGASRVYLHVAVLMSGCYKSFLAFLVCYVTSRFVEGPGTGFAFDIEPSKF